MQDSVEDDELATYTGGVKVKWMEGLINNLAISRGPD